jgi:hypothetical protein
MRLKLVRPPPRPAVQGKFLAARAELDAALVARDDENDLILTALVAGKHPRRPARVRQGDQLGTVPHRGNDLPRGMCVWRSGLDSCGGRCLIPGCRPLPC